MAIMFVSCKGELEIKTAIKQRIIQGVNSAKPFVNYVFEIQNHTSKKKEVDSLIVIENGQCFRINYSLRIVKTPKLLKAFTDKGIYKMEASMLQGNRSKLLKCTNKEDQVILYYKDDAVQKQLKFTSFEEKTERRR